MKGNYSTTVGAELPVAEVEFNYEVNWFPNWQPGLLAFIDHDICQSEKIYVSLPA